jgi:DNA-directed RNA polymerase subunit RPC12/RpoP
MMEEYIDCPSCGARLYEEDLAAGFCENCGLEFELEEAA